MHTLLFSHLLIQFSGRTTLLRNILGGKERSTITSERVYQIPGFRMYEAIVRRDLTDNTMDIFPSVKQQAEVVCLCLYVQGVCGCLCMFVCANCACIILIL